MSIEKDIYMNTFLEWSGVVLMGLVFGFLGAWGVLGNSIFLIIK